MESEHRLESLHSLARPMGNGFSRQGSMRYHSKEKLNLLGGGMKFTVDLSGVQDMVNANLYMVIPGTLMSGSNFYCDNSEGFVEKGNACVELDIFESNGHKLAASTMHTKLGTNSGCDTWGCRTLFTFNSNTINSGAPFEIEMDVASDGDLTVVYRQSGKTEMVFQNPSGWDSAAKAAVVEGMSNHGAVVVSSLWTGWVPPNNSGKGDLNGSKFTVSDVMYKGSSKGNTM